MESIVGRVTYQMAPRSLRGGGPGSYSNLCWRLRCIHYGNEKNYVPAVQIHSILLPFLGLSLLRTRTGTLSWRITTHDSFARQAVSQTRKGNRSSTMAHPHPLSHVRTRSVEYLNKPTRTKSTTVVAIQNGRLWQRILLHRQRQHTVLQQSARAENYP